MKTNFNFDAGPGEMRLSELEPGQVAIVRGLDEGPPGRRLLDLGFFPQTRVRAVRRAPLGDPIVFELRGYRLCIRRADAEGVRVELEGVPRENPSDE